MLSNLGVPALAALAAANAITKSRQQPVSRNGKLRFYALERQFWKAKATTAKQSL